MEQATKNEPDDLGTGAARGVVWLTAQKWVARLTGLFTITLLTRLLRPEDFGLVAAASALLPLLYLLADLGFAAYIVQVTKVTRVMLSTGFWFSITVGLLLTGGLALAAPLVAASFSDARVTDVIRVMSIAILLTAASSIPTALLRRAMRFRALAVQGTSAALVAQGVAIVMALSGMGVWALVGQALVAQVVTCALVWLSARWVPSWSFSWGHFKTMAFFGSQVLGVELVAAIRAWAEAAIVGSILGLAALGYLTVAQRLVQIILDLTGSAIAPVTQVAFAKIKNSATRLLRAYLRALTLSLAVLPPPLTLVAVAGPLIIPIVFSDQWAPSHSVAQVLALASILAFAAYLDQGLFYGVGRPFRWFVYAVAIDGLTVAVTAVAARWGLVSVALGFLGVTIVATVIRWFLVARLLDSSPGMVARPFGLMAISVTTSGAAGFAAVWLTGGWPPLWTVMVTGIVILVTHVAVVRLLSPQVSTEIVQLARRFLRRTEPRTRGRDGRLLD